MAYQSYQDLTVWKKAMELTEEVYLMVKKLPKEETYALSDQMRRSAVSIPSNIAEGHGRQTYSEFRNFLSIANGSCAELQTQLLICIRLRYLTGTEAEKSLRLTNEINRMLTALIFRLRQKTEG